MPDFKFSNNAEKKRYELDLGDGKVAFIDYILTGQGVTYLTHTEVPVGYEGQGNASKIIRLALEDIEVNGRELFPICPFVNSYLDRHPEWKKRL